MARNSQWGLSRTFREADMHKFTLPEHIASRIMERRGRLHPYEAIDPKKTALVVIDMQNAFLAPGAAVEIPAARDLVPNINRLAKAVRAAGGQVVWVKVTLNRASDWPNFCNFVLGPSAARALVEGLTDGSDGHRIWPGLDVRDGDLMVSKNRFSAFLPAACELPAMLRARSVDTVLITGTLTNVCCESSARDAAMLDFKTIMISDANATRSDEEHAATLVSFLQSFGDVRTTGEIVDMLRHDAGIAGRIAESAALP
jgi:ureidoacrylate peracid hydrolase